MSELRSKYIELTALTDGKFITDFIVSVTSTEYFLSFLRHLQMHFAYDPISFDASEYFLQNPS